MAYTNDPYAPCPCGSGKKFKFCCYLKKQEMASESRGPFASLFLPGGAHRHTDTGSPGQINEALAIMQNGLRRMNGGDFQSAIPLFRQALDVAPIVHSAANNLALCLFVIGRLDEAIRVQRECLETNPLPNPFGLANLASFHHIMGEESQARRYLEEAIALETPSADACVKLCEVMARFKEHRQILEYADGNRYGREGTVCFFTGVAAANLGERERAMADLRRVPISFGKSPMARRYLAHLRENSKPCTLQGDWPYLLPQEICLFKFSEMPESPLDSEWMGRRVLVDYCEAVLNEAPDETEAIMPILTALKHPNAVRLLWTIVNGEFGPDALRLEAVMALRQRNEVKSTEHIELLIDGERRSMETTQTTLNPEFQFAAQLPPKLDKQYIKAIQTMEGERPDWKSAEKIFQMIMQEVPDFFPAQYNYAVSLIRRGLTDEAVPIIRTLVKKHPEYLFARGTLMQILIGNGRIKEAEKLITSAPVIEETHPAAMAMWLVAQAQYYEYLEEDEKAFRFIRNAHQLMPEMAAVKAMWECYKNY